MTTIGAFRQPRHWLPLFLLTLTGCSGCGDTTSTAKPPRSFTNG